ncbi:hypothetical protein PENANT_c001G03100 [Penicillium antarcticum]|uniref:Uncharacterized protein n=1 Tax=Penicillium antarcticum TaxID=416450 RepID=A0A1V6QNU1_9EURO|nr:hypothetical protein PENANT_c001G03100 [Penicillium antarcticum]
MRFCPSKIRLLMLAATRTIPRARDRPSKGAKISGNPDSVTPDELQ